MTIWFFELKKGKKHTCMAKDLNKALDDLTQAGLKPKNVVGMSTRISYHHLKEGSKS